MKKFSIITLLAVLELFASRASAETCAERAESVNRDVAYKKASAFFDAGFMYEYGMCVEQDWEKAGQYYQQAAQRGIRLAPLRLIALYAAQYRDPAAAIWWAAQRPSMLSKECMPTSDPLKSTEAFLSELRGWSTAQLKACTYYAGVISRLTINNEIAAAFLGITSNSTHSAQVIVTVKLDDGAIELYDTEDRQLVIARVLKTLEPDFSSKPNSESEVAGLWQAGVEALKEFGKPPANESAWAPQSTLMVPRNSPPLRRRLEIDVHQ